MHSGSQAGRVVKAARPGSRSWKIFFFSTGYELTSIHLQGTVAKRQCLYRAGRSEFSIETGTFRLAKKCPELKF